jgi:hypothetical protein
MLWFLWFFIHEEWFMDRQRYLSECEEVATEYQDALDGKGLEFSRREMPALLLMTVGGFLVLVVGFVMMFYVTWANWGEGSLGFFKQAYVLSVMFSPIAGLMFFIHCGGAYLGHKIEIDQGNEVRGYREQFTVNSRFKRLYWQLWHRRKVYELLGEALEHYLQSGHEDHREDLCRQHYFFQVQLLEDEAFASELLAQKYSDGSCPGWDYLLIKTHASNKIKVRAKIYVELESVDYAQFPEEYFCLMHPKEAELVDFKLILWHCILGSLESVSSVAS